VIWPSTKVEQTAIATILSDMDTEIAALETQLAKTRSLKQGMMHNLLTGRIRLIESGKLRMESGG
jgi:type I restriction enzyme S subunit